MELTIDNNRIYELVSMKVSVIGRSLNDASGNSLYDKVRIQDRDKDVLELFRDDAWSLLIKKLGDFVKEATDSKIVLVDDRRINEAVMGNLSDAINDYMVYNVCADWMKLKAAEYAPVYEGKAESLLAFVLEAIRLKKEPTLKTINNK